ncbi:MAG: CotH kinase family protein [Planctomycetota bacterium]|nr:CotH kinase family protein [Planctomycetota bacterium]
MKQRTLNPAKVSLFCYLAIYSLAPANAQAPASTQEAKPAQSTIADRNPESTLQLQAAYYHPETIQSVYLDIDPVDRQRMLDALPECIYVPASFRWKDIRLPKVAVRFKGSSSSHPQQKHKRSFLVKFNQDDKEKRFLGLRRVSFDNGVQFGSLFSEPIITGILAKVGLKTHRCNYAKVFLNQRYLGVYVNVERIDESFIERHFPGSKGGLWKNDLGGPGGNLQFIGDDPKAYKKAFEPKNRPAEKTQAPLVALTRLINQTNKEQVNDVLPTHIAIDDFLHHTAVLLLSGAFDQLTGWNHHNFYLYRETPQNRWHYFPWDLDVGFCEIAFGRIYVLKDWHAAWPIPRGQHNPLLERIIETPQLLARYRQIAQKILENHFEPTQLCQTVDRHYDLIRESLESDPFPHQRATVPTDTSYDDIVQSIKSFIRKRYRSAQQELANPGQRPQPVNRSTAELPQGAPAALGKKMQAAMQEARQLQQRLQRIDKLFRQAGPLLQQGKHEQAEKLIEQALELIRQN